MTNLMGIIADEKNERFTASRQKLYDGILSKSGFQVVTLSDFPKHSNIIGNRFVLSIEDPGITKNTIQSSMNIAKLP